MMVSASCNINNQKNDFVGFLINLDSSRERLVRASNSLKISQIPYRRISAIDGRIQHINQFPEYDDQAARKFMGRSLLGGEIGCFMSHLACLKELAGGEHEFAVIFEDDAIVLPKANHIIRAAIQVNNSKFLKSGNSWEVFHLCADSIKIYSPYMVVEGHRIVQSHYFPMRCTGVVWSRSGARSFLNQFENIDAPYDIYLRRWVGFRDNALAVHPAVVEHTKVDSDISPASDVNRSRYGRTKSYAIARFRRILMEKICGYKLKLLK